MRHLFASPLSFFVLLLYIYIYIYILSLLTFLSVVSV